MVEQFNATSNSRFKIRSLSITQSKGSIEREIQSKISRVRAFFIIIRKFKGVSVKQINISYENLPL